MKLNHALYYFKVKGYLSAVDIIREIGHMRGKISKSEIIKKELISGIFDEAQLSDQEIRGQLVEALRSIPKDKWEDREYYGVEDKLIQQPNII